MLADYLDEDDEVLLRAGRVLPHERQAVQALFEENALSQFFGDVDRRLRALRSLPISCAPRRSNVQPMLCRIAMHKLQGPAKSRTGPYFVMKDGKAPPHFSVDCKAERYVYRKAYRYYAGDALRSGAYATGKTKPVPPDAQIVLPAAQANMLRKGDAARFCDYMLRHKVQTKAELESGEAFADDLRYFLSDGGCQDPQYWHDKDAAETPGSSHQLRIMLPLPDNFEHGDFEVFAQSLARQLRHMDVQFLLAIHGGPKIGKPAASEPTTSYHHQPKRRNLHAHIALSTRHGSRTATGYRFAARKTPALQDRDIFKRLRSICADAVNAALALRGAVLRVTPLPLAPKPGEPARMRAVHLGPRAHQLEQLGVATSAGHHNTKAAMDYRLSKLERLIEKDDARLQTLLAGTTADEKLQELICERQELRVTLALINWTAAEHIKRLLREERAWAQRHASPARRRKMKRRQRTASKYLLPHRTEQRALLPDPVIALLQAWPRKECKDLITDINENMVQIQARMRLVVATRQREAAARLVREMMPPHEPPTLVYQPARSWVPGSKPKLVPVPQPNSHKSVFDKVKSLFDKGRINLLGPDREPQPAPAKLGPIKPPAITPPRSTPTAPKATRQNVTPDDLTQICTILQKHVRPGTIVEPDTLFMRMLADRSTFPHIIMDILAAAKTRNAETHIKSVKTARDILAFVEACRQIHAARSTSADSEPKRTSSLETPPSKGQQHLTESRQAQNSSKSATSAHTNTIVRNTKVNSDAAVQPSIQNRATAEKQKIEAVDAASRFGPVRVSSFDPALQSRARAAIAAKPDEELMLRLNANMTLLADCDAGRTRLDEATRREYLYGLGIVRREAIRRGLIMDQNIRAQSSREKDRGR